MSDSELFEIGKTPKAQLQDLPRTADKSYLGVLYRAKTANDLDTRIKINLQQDLIEFFKDPNKWLYLSRAEQRKLLYRLKTQQKMTASFATEVKIKCFDDDGKIGTKDVILLLDAGRNKNLGSLFDKIINQDIASIFFEEFCFGLLELIDKLIHIQSVTINSLETLLSDEVPLDQKLFFPLSAKELILVHNSGNGIEVELIPRFLRLPLNKLFYAVKREAPEFPSLVLQFYLDRYFLSDFWLEKYKGTTESSNLIRIFLSKAFHAIHRASGLTPEQLDLPEANHSNRFQYLTLNDEDTASLFSSEGLLSEAQLELRNKFKKFLAQPEPPEDTKQRRVVTGPSFKVTLTLDKVFEEILNDYSERYLADKTLNPEGHQEFARPIWLPQDPNLGMMTASQRAHLEAHLTEILSPTYQSQLTPAELAYFNLWFEMVESEYSNEATQSQLEALGVDKERFSQELLLLLAQRHQLLVSQNAVAIVKGLVQHLTLMVRLGTLSLEMLIQQRYDRISNEVLPYVYHVQVVNVRGEIVWSPSPYPFGALLYVLKFLPDLMTAHTDQIDQASIQLARSLLEVLFNFEQKQAQANDGNPFFQEDLEGLEL